MAGSITFGSTDSRYMKLRAVVSALATLANDSTDVTPVATDDFPRLEERFWEGVGEFADRVNEEFGGFTPFGTAAYKDIPASGDATTSQVVYGTDSRLTNARTPTAHTHTTAALTDLTAIGSALATAVDAASARTTLGLGTLATQNGTFSGTSSGTNTGDQTITLTGDVTGSGTGSFAATLANVVTGATKGSTAAKTVSVTFNAKGLVTAASEQDIAINGSQVTAGNIAVARIATALTTPGPIGSTTPSTGAFTTLSATGQITSTLATGTAPFSVASTTVVANLNVSALNGKTFDAPGPIGSTTASTGAFTTFSASGVVQFSANGALSAPAVSFTGTPITGGTATTTKPLVLIETAGATSTGWSTAGTMLGINSPSGFVGRAIDYLLNGVTQFRVNYDGQVFSSTLNLSSVATLLWSGRGNITSPAAGQIQLGLADAAAPVAQTLSVQSVVAGTSNTAGANWTLKGSASSGSGAGGNIVWQVTPAGSSGTAQNAFVTGLSLEPSGTGGSAVRIGSGTTSPLLFNFSGVTTSTAVAAATSLAFYHSGNGVNEYGFAFTGANRSGTSGAVSEINASRAFVPTSGSGVYNQLQIAPTINQTGGANGITRGIYINPTLTAAADFRALEIAAGKTIFATSGALSEPAVSFTGTPIAGGTTTTTKPLVLIEPMGTTSTGWDLNGAMFGINMASGFSSGYAIDVQKNGVRIFSVFNSGSITTSGNVSASGAVSAGATANISWSTRGILSSPAAGQIQLGAADAASPVAQTLSVQSVVAGTSNTAGANWTLKGSAGTGTGAGGNIIFQVAPAGSSGSSQNAYSTALTINGNTLLATFGGQLTTGGAIQIPAASAFYWATRSVIKSPSDSVITLLNNAETSFDRLQFGGTTSSFGAIARNGAGLKIVLASSSSTLSDLTCSTLTTQGYTVATLPAAGTAGRRAHVTDALAPAFLAAVVGGGAVTCPVFDDGSAWVVG